MERYINPSGEPPKEDPTDILDEVDEATQPTEATDPIVDNEFTPEEMAEEFKQFSSQLRVLLYEAKFPREQTMSRSSLYLDRVDMSDEENVFIEADRLLAIDQKHNPLVPNVEGGDEVLTMKILCYDLRGCRVEIWLEAGTSQQADNTVWLISKLPKDKSQDLPKTAIYGMSRSKEGSSSLEARNWEVNRPPWNPPVKSIAYSFHRLLEECQNTGDDPEPVRYWG